MGDPTILGWTVTLLYLLCSYLCYRSAKSIAFLPSWEKERWGWTALCLATLLLGVNKQADLQLHFTRVGKRLVYALGLYDLRWVFRLGVFLVAFVLLSAAALLLVLLMRQASAHLNLALTGLLVVFLYIVIRIALFQHVSARFSGPLSLLLEPLGLALVGYGARRFDSAHLDTAQSQSRKA